MSIGIVARRRRKTRRGLLHADSSVFVMRPGTPVSPFRDTRALYPLDVAERKIDRTAWAGITRKILDEEHAGNKTAFGAAIDSDRKTINRWLAEDVDVSEDMVRKVARKHNLRPMDLLIEVGYYGAQDVRHEPAPVADGDELLELIATAPVTPSQKREMQDHVAAKRAEYETALKAEIERWIALVRRPRRRAQ
jgi:hypothetical protein